MTTISHADTLRGMAEAFMMAGSHERVDTCLAGADALDALHKVRKVADLLDQMAGDNRQAATQLDWAAPGAIGREHAYTKAAQFIREATGDTNDA